MSSLAGEEARFICGGGGGGGGGAELMASELVVVELVEGSNFSKADERLLGAVVVVVRVVESESGFLIFFLTLRIRFSASITH